MLESLLNKVSGAAGNFINEETPAQYFPRPLTLFEKVPSQMFDWVINTPLYYLPI